MDFNWRIVRLAIGISVIGLPVVAFANDMRPPVLNSSNPISFEKLARVVVGATSPDEREAALGELQQAAAAKNAGALYQLGDLYLKGAGVPADPAKGRAYLEEAIAAGNTSAASRLGGALVRGREVPRDTGLGLELLKSSASAGSSSAMVILGELALLGGTQPVDGKAALRYFDQAAKAGGKDGYRRIGELYRDGRGVPKNERLALRYFEKAVASGDRQALLSIGAGYLYGTFGTRNLTKAKEYFVRAHADGVQYAVVYIANMSLTPESTSKIRLQAVKLLEDAASNGNPAALKALVGLYRDGRAGVMRQNLAKARTVLDEYRSLIPSDEFILENLVIDAVGSIGLKQFSIISRRFDELSPSLQERFMNMIRWRQENVYVFILQSRLRNAGYYKASLNGNLDTQTLSAISKFCISRNIADLCRAGPLSSAATQSIARELP